MTSDRQVGYVQEPNELREVWREFTEGALTSPNLWTDAYLCAFANSARLTLLTFNTKIPIRKDVSCLLLRGGESS